MSEGPPDEPMISSEIPPRRRRSATHGGQHVGLWVATFLEANMVKTSPGRKRNQLEADGHDAEQRRMFKSRGLPAGGPVEYDAAAGVPANHRTAKRPALNVTEHRRENQPPGGSAETKAPFANLKNGKE